MKFVQIIDYRTSKFDEMQKVGEEWEASGTGQDRVSRRILCADRDVPGRYLNIVEFNSYEDAMENSNDPTTQEFAGRMMALADGPPTFINLDLIEEHN
jgi:hypothetical protein